MKTKQLIYQCALDLFSTEGYHNVGMRDIAKQVGIRASSIYNHYKSKEEIINEIADSLIAKMKQSVYPLYKQTDLEPQDFLTNISIRTNQFFETAEIEKILTILIPHQTDFAYLQNLIHEEFIVKARGAFTYYFKQLIKQKRMKEIDPSLAAKMYHSYFIYNFYEKYLTTNHQDFLSSHQSDFLNHIRLFINYFEIK